MSETTEVPKLIEGLQGVDDRGSVSFVNGFSFQGVKRFYVVENHTAGFVRAWHAHRLEAKWVTVVQGAALVAVVRVDNWESPSKSLMPTRQVISTQRPAVFYIPPGYANGFMSLTPNARIMFFSTATVEESQADDFRYDSRWWDPWKVVER